MPDLLPEAGIGARPEKGNFGSSGNKPAADLPHNDVILDRLLDRILLVLGEDFRLRFLETTQPFPFSLRFAAGI